VCRRAILDRCGKSRPKQHTTVRQTFLKKQKTDVRNLLLYEIKVITEIFTVGGEA
jgi:hypothetical protein